MRTTNSRYTETAVGNIPHKRHPLGFDAPVRIVLTRPPRGGELIITPEAAQEGGYAYALPGGGRWVAAPSRPTL